ncbi:ECF transporter S component [Streptococcus chenjunshii]|uniref:ECF transporter S component n=1 Tax=Streptococcus chenjunshii TaxID=2173853 RepID=A0A372KP32_9STRE|nr:ECF transporter S component [Streptococcus chenjunshii]AXQ78671.1 ECF transporter S component [Streptococcus chenjunshii]RFU51736.1 ECF transporter S component [Streptococcus chenjunshii]RFU54057.1 ECF transporter S component [Streptococcus chenjunshii]
MNKRKSSDVATISIFFAAMLLIHLLSSLLFSVWLVPIKPTLMHIPVIIASIVYGPKVGGALGGLMGLISMITNTLVLLPTSYLFSPFVENGTLASALIAFLPRILIGIVPYFIYKWFHNKTGLFLAGLLGSLTNTVFVLSGIFIFFSSVYGNDIKRVLGTIITANSVAEMVISAILTAAIVPSLLKLKK